MAIADTAYNKDINDKPPDELCSVIYFIFSSKEDNFYKLICEDDDFFSYVFFAPRLFNKHIIYNKYIEKNLYLTKKPHLPPLKLKTKHDIKLTRHKTELTYQTKISYL